MSVNCFGFLKVSVIIASILALYYPQVKCQDASKWYQCIEHPDSCCERTTVFCRPNCENGCYFKEIVDGNQYFGGDGGSNYLFPTWMSQLSDNLKLTEMSIPGTHDTAARDTNNVAETQTMTITEQLEAGIRVFDARCRHINDAFAMHHERVYLNLAFGDVLDMSCDFLRSNPGEMIIIRVKEEYDGEGNSRSFQETLQQHYIEGSDWSSFIDTSATLGTLGEHRGKIRLFNDHGCESDQFGYCWGSAHVQDSYDLPLLAPPFTETYAEWKMEKVKENLVASDADNDNLYINFSSAQRLFVVSPRSLAESDIVSGVNELATNLLKDNPTAYKKTGLFMMDFPGSALIYQILLRN